jgi:hypothetical protein
MAQKEVAFEIRANDTHFFPAPPIRFERPPILVANEARDDDEAILELNSPAPPNVLYGAINWIHLF